MIHYFHTQALRLATIFALSVSTVACVMIPDSHNTPQRTNTAPAELQLTQNIARQLTKLNNEIHVPNILYVSTQHMMIEDTPYTLLSLHTTDQRVYRTRVETAKLNQATIERLKALKGATLIGILPIDNYPQQYFFRNYRNLKF